MLRNSQLVCPTNEGFFSGKVSDFRILEFGPEGYGNWESCKCVKYQLLNDTIIQLLLSILRLQREMISPHQGVTTTCCYSSGLPVFSSFFLVRESHEITVSVALMEHPGDVSVIIGHRLPTRTFV